MPYSNQAPVTPVKSYYQPYLECKNSPKVYYPSYNTAADSSNKKSKNVYYEDEENLS